MRILILTQQLISIRTGVGTYAHALAVALVDRGHDVTVGTPDPQAAEVFDFDVRRVPLPRFDPMPDMWLAAGFAFRRFVTQEDHGYDIIHFADAREAWAAPISTVPLTGMVNDSYALDWLSPGYPRHRFDDRWLRGAYYSGLRLLESRAYQRLAGIMANSDYVASAITTGYSIDQSKVSVIYYGLPEQESVSPVPLEGNPSILFVGSNFQRKGLPILLEVLSELAKELPDVHLHVVGVDRNQEQWKRRILESDVHQFITLYGWQSNQRVRSLMAGADVFALPSLTEAFGLVYLEALQAGTPVVATSVGGIGELFHTDPRLVAVDPTDATEIAAAIKRLQFVERSDEQQVVSRLTPEIMAQQTERVFIEALRATKRRDNRKSVNSIDASYRSDGPTHEGRKSFSKAVRLIAGLIGFGFLAYIFWDTWQRSIEMTMPSWRQAIGSLPFVLGGLLFAARGWVALIGPVPRTGLFLKAFFSSQLGKYVPGIVWQPISQIGMTTEAGVAMGRAAVAFPVHALVQVSAAGSVGAFLLVSGQSVAPSIRLLALLGVGTIALLHRPWMTVALDLVRRRISIQGNSSLLPSQSAILRSYAWGLGAIALGGAAFAVLLPGADPLEIKAVTSFALAWGVGFVAIPFPSGVGVREAVLLLTLDVSGGAIVASSLALRLTTIIGEVTWIAFSVLSERVRARSRRSFP